MRQSSLVHLFLAVAIFWITVSCTGSAARYPLLSDHVEADEDTASGPVIENKNPNVFAAPQALVEGFNLIDQIPSINQTEYLTTHFFTNPQDAFKCYDWRYDVIYCGDTAVSSVVDWCKTTNYTGISVPQGFSRGKLSNPGENFFQWYGNQAGAYINTSKIDTSSVITFGGPHITLFKKYSSGKPVFNTALSEFVIQCRMNIAKAEVTNNAVAQASFLFYLRNTPDLSDPQGVTIHYVVLLYDTRVPYNPNEYISYDPTQKLSFISARLQPNTTYSALRSGSKTQCGGAYSANKLFRVHITGKNIEQVIAKMNEKRSVKLPVESHSWHLTGFGWHMEIANVNGPENRLNRMIIGLSQTGLKAMEYIPKK